MRRSFVFCTALLLALVVTRVSAQEPVPLQVSGDSSFRVGPTAAERPRDPALQLPELDPDLWSSLRRARHLVGAGAGIVVGSAIHLAWATPNRVCNYNVRTASLYAAGIAGGVGLSFALGGGAMLGLSSPSDKRYAAPRGQIIGAAALALGTALASQFILGMLFTFESAGACSS